MPSWQTMENCPSDPDEVVWVKGGRHERPALLPADGDWWRYEGKRGSKSVPTH